MFRQIILIIYLLLCCTAGASIASESKSNNDLVVVVHKNNPVDKLSKDQLIDLFMGKYVAFPDGKKAIPLDINDSSQLKKQFYQALVGLPLARVNAYWSRIKFTGRARPPQEMANEQALVSFMNSQDRAIGYLPRSKVTKNLKVVYQFSE